MERKNYDTWAIEHHPEEVYDAINGLENTRNNTLYTNITSQIKVGRTEIPMQFDTAFFCDDIDRLILLMKDGKLSRKEFYHILESKKIPFHKVHFMKTEQEYKPNDSKEVWFAANIDVLKDAFQNTKAEYCVYLPDIKGSLKINYSPDEMGEVLLEKQGIRGVILVGDAIVLLMDNGHEKNIKYQDALKVIYESDVTPLLSFGEEELPEEEIAYQYQKEQ